MTPADEELRFEAVHVSPWMLRQTASPPSRPVEETFLDILSDSGERLPWTEDARDSSAMLGTGALAATGYVLLNSRLGLWLLGLLTSQPLWKQFDPMDVLYAWEENSTYAGTEDDETLATLVEEW